MSSLLDVRKQLTFYGAYHSHPVNVAIHIFGVPALVWSAAVLLTLAPVPSLVPPFRYVFNDYLVFDLNTPAFLALLYMSYYVVLEPTAAILYMPQMIFTVLSATAFAPRPNGIRDATVIHVGSWILQFIGHGLAEGRAPALLDNLLGAVVLAPFFVHLELLFALGYRPDLHHQIKNDVGKQIAIFRREEAEKRRTAEKKAM